MNEITFEFEFVIDHEDFKGSISCTKSIKVDKDIDDTVVIRTTYEELRLEAIEDFMNRWTIVEENE